MKTPFQTVLSGVSQPWGISLPSHAVVGCAQEQLCRSRRARPRSGAGSSVPRVSGSRWCLCGVGSMVTPARGAGREGTISFPANLRIPRCRQVVREEGCRLQRAGLRGSMPGRELGLSSQAVRPRCALSRRTPRTGTRSSRARAALGAALHPPSEAALPSSLERQGENPGSGTDPSTEEAECPRASLRTLLIQCPTAAGCSWEFTFRIGF